MQINLKSALKEKVRDEDAASILNISTYTWKKYQRTGRIPDNIAYVMSQKGFIDLPHDFEYYTSTNVLLNLAYHRVTEKELEEKTGISKHIIYQTKYAGCNYFLYEFKELLQQLFDPFILPYYKNGIRTIYCEDHNYMVGQRGYKLKSPKGQE